MSNIENQLITMSSTVAPYLVQETGDPRYDSLITTNQLLSDIINMQSKQIESMDTALKAHDDNCWRCLSDDEELITYEWLKWVGFEYVRRGWYLPGFSFGEQIKRYNGMLLMDTTHNEKVVTKRWEVRSLLAVHRDKLLECGYVKLWVIKHE